MPVSDPDVSRPRLIRDASFLEADRREIALRRGHISAREVYDQVNACSCLTLILACIVYWQAREISRIAAAPDFPFDPDPAASCQPDRVEERHPLRRDQDRPRQAKCASSEGWHVQWETDPPG